MSEAPTIPPNPELPFDPTTLPIAQLESLRFKANQIISSIQALAWTIEYGGAHAMPSWPEILSKYTVLLSQTHTFSSALLSVPGSAPVDGPGTSQGGLARLALHPRVGLSDTQLDNDFIPLLRNQQTTDVLRMESAAVRRLSEHMETRGALGVSAPTSGPGANTGPKPEHEDVIRECAEIRDQHDRRADRAIRAVAMLREKYNWRERVAVDEEEPEELDWDPMAMQGVEPTSRTESGTPGDHGSTDDEEELENVLGTGAEGTPGSSEAGTPM